MFPFVEFGGPEKDRLWKVLEIRSLLSSILLGLFWEKNSLDVGENTALGDGHTGQQFIQLLVVPDGQLTDVWG